MPSSKLGRLLNSNNATQTHSNFVKLSENTFLGMPKVRPMVNLDIANALGQNLANSESCPILRLL